MTLKVRILQFLTTFAQLTARLKSFLTGWLLVLSLQKSLVGYVTVCVKSDEILLYRVSSYALFFKIWLWQTERYKSNLVWREFWNPEMWTFWKLQPVFILRHLLSNLQTSKCFFWKKEFKCTYCKAFFNFLNVFLFGPLIKGKKYL